MKANFCCGYSNGRAYEEYYMQQGGHGVPVFHRAHIQRGHEIGSIFGGLFRSFFPTLKRQAPIIGRKALQTRVQLADDIISSQSFKEAVKNRVSHAFQEGINTITPLVSNQSSSGFRGRDVDSRKRSLQQLKLSKQRQTYFCE